MQNPEIYRRGIVIPLDDATEQALRTNKVCESTNVRLLKIADNSEFEAIWELGLFREINARCSTLVDDFEDEVVEPEFIGEVIAAIDSLEPESKQNSKTEKLLEDLRNLAIQARRSDRPLFFVLWLRWPMIPNPEFNDPNGKILSLFRDRGWTPAEVIEPNDELRIPTTSGFRLTPSV